MHLIDDKDRPYRPGNTSNTMKESHTHTHAPTAKPKASKVGAFGKALKNKITNAMPSRSFTVDNKKNPDSAYSKMMRATAAKKAPSREQANSYHY